MVASKEPAELVAFVSLREGAEEFIADKQLQRDMLIPGRLAGGRHF